MYIYIYMYTYMYIYISIYIFKSFQSPVDIFGHRHLYGQVKLGLSPFHAIMYTEQSRCTTIQIEASHIGFSFPKFGFIRLFRVYHIHNSSPFIESIQSESIFSTIILNRLNLVLFPIRFFIFPFSFSFFFFLLLPLCIG